MVDVQCVVCYEVVFLRMFWLVVSEVEVAENGQFL